MKRRRVKITGIGPVTPAGIGREAFWKGILEPVSRVRPYPDLDPDFGPFVAAYLDTFNVAHYFDRTLVPKGAARQTLFAIAGAALALKDAGISKEELQRSAAAVLTGSCMMDFGGIVDSIDSVTRRGVRGVLPRVLSTMGLAGVATGVNQALGLAARVLAVSTQCSSGADALGHAASLVASGEVDIAVCGGTEAPLSRFPLIEIRAAEMTPGTDEMPSRLSRPFDRWRTTGVVAEGACMFILEPEESPRPGYSYLAGYAYSNDEHDDLCGGLVRSGRLAMAEAGVRPNEIDSISAWGPGHKKVDAGEANAMQRLFGDGLRELPVVSIKGAVGTPLGAAAAMQVAAVALGQRHGLMPPTVNWEFPDPACPLNLSNRPRAIAQRLTLVNSHGLGGLNASLVLERC